MSSLQQVGIAGDPLTRVIEEKFPLATLACRSVEISTNNFCMQPGRFSTCNSCTRSIEFPLPALACRSIEFEFLHSDWLSFYEQLLHAGRVRGCLAFNDCLMVRPSIQYHYIRNGITLRNIITTVLTLSLCLEIPDFLKQPEYQSLS
jgi:hypothetical protein